jgi:hypothetical protein
MPASWSAGSPVPSASGSPAGGTSLELAFRSAAAESGLPEDLLLAVGYVNTHWRMETSDDGGVGIIISCTIRRTTP